jgi:glucose-6-phosphate 1-dehydrogenase
MWQAQSDAPPTYEAGEWGPPEADDMIAKDGRRWRTL